MKKTARIVLAIVFVLGIIMASSPLTALAKSSEGPGGATSNPVIAAGSWTSGKYENVTTLAVSAPSWLQLLSDGVKVTDAGKICHPFRGGQYGWVGQIMQYKDGKWVKLETVNDWVPNKEGEFMSCAQAPAAGTYALFGYWKRPAGYVEQSNLSYDCGTIVWSGFDSVFEGSVYFNGNVVTVPENTTISFVINSSDPVGASGSGTGKTDSDGDFVFSSGIPEYSYEELQITFYESTHNCSSTIQTFTYK